MAMDLEYCVVLGANHDEQQKSGRNSFLEAERTLQDINLIPPPCAPTGKHYFHHVNQSIITTNQQQQRYSNLLHHDTSFNGLSQEHGSKLTSRASSNADYPATNRSIIRIETQSRGQKPIVNPWIQHFTNAKHIAEGLGEPRHKEQTSSICPSYSYDKSTIHKTTIQLQQQQPRAILATLLLLFTLLNDQNALFCYGLGATECPDDNCLVGNNNNPERLPFMNSMRRLQNDPLPMFSPMATSLYRNPTPQGQPGGSSPILTYPTSDLQNDLDSHIKTILVPRVSGTQGNVEVRNYIVRTLENLNYVVELDEFEDQTPIGEVKFANIIAWSNPKACRQLVIACHHDSKMMDGFLGATDSAVPCAMMLKMADTFKNSYRSGNLGLQFIFFDGEEAYETWGPTDSLYGSRHLAAKWEKQAAPTHCGLKNELGRMELLMVLDLIGAKDTSFINYNWQLRGQYARLQKIEKLHLANTGFTGTQIRKESTFRGGFIPLYAVEDDHVPFYKRGVPVISLLAHPFPKVWHKIDDNYTAIDFPRTMRIHRVLEEYVATYTKD